MVMSISYIVFFVFLYIGLVFVEKTEKEINIIIWLPPIFLIILCYQAFALGLVNLLKVPINLLTVTLVNAFFAMIVWGQILKKKKIQKIKGSKVDAIYLIIIVVIAFFCWVKQFGLLPEINYITSDPGTHFRQAIELLQTQKLGSMYFAPLTNAVALELFQPFLESTRLYRAFIVVEYVMYALSGTLFYSLLTVDSGDQKWNIKLVPFLISVFYMLGYPRNNMIFGFVYLGMGVSIIVLILFLTNYIYENKKINMRIVFFIICSLLSVGVCYSLFVPVVYIGFCVFICIETLKKNGFSLKNSAFEAIKTNFILFLIPTLLVLAYSIFNLSTFGSEASNGISREGYVYRNLYANFLLFLPFSIYGVLESFKKRRTGAIFTITLSLLLFIVVLLIMGQSGKVASYYFYKNHYLLIMLFFYYVNIGIIGMLKVEKKFVIGFSLMSLVLLMNWSVNLEGKLASRTTNYVVENESNFYFDIYNFNREKLRYMMPISEDKILLYEEFYNKYNTDEIIYNGSIEDFNWFCGVTSKPDLDQVVFWEYYNEETLFELIKAGILTEETAKLANTYGTYFDQRKENLSNDMYIIVMNDIIEGGWKNLQYSGKIDLIYENSAGIIGKIRFD